MTLNTDDSAHYNELVSRQVEQYRETEIMHDLPPIYNYWSGKHNVQKASHVIDHSTLTDFYAGNFLKSLQQSPAKYLISVGSGDCSIEIDIVENLIARDVKDFSFVCLELSPILIEKGRKKIAEKGIGNYISVEEIDLNKWKPAFEFAGVMAHHALHHILDLEHLFKLIKENLAPQGRFITCDIIGRNGHMRWPESLRLTRAIWQRLPRKYKYHHLFKKYDDYFENWDCASEGFEGIRAQDILPLLVKMFSFETFFSYGNLIDPFIDRGFGPNFNTANVKDTAFIDYVQELNEMLISRGLLKPTFMVAVMVNEPVAHAKIYKHWTPEFAVRYPESQAPDSEIHPLLQGIPYQLTEEDDPLIVNQVGHYTLGTKLLFTNSQEIELPAFSGIQFLKNGWTSPEKDYTWSVCEEGAVILPLAQPVHEDVRLTIKFMAYCSSVYTNINIEVNVNDTHIQTLTYENKGRNIIDTLDIILPAGLLEQGKIDLNFLLPNRRAPQYESGNDVRELGIALISLSTKLNRMNERAKENWFTRLLHLMGRKNYQTNRQ